MTVETPTSQPATWSRQLNELARDIKISHSVFALPFALLGGYLAAGHGGRLLHDDLRTLGLILICMVLARTMAMTVNRLADRRIDAENPRTARRAIPSGRLTAGYMLAATVICAVGFILATMLFWIVNANPWPALLSPLVLAWLSLYSYTKRFTWLCHLFLGSALAISPLAAAVAVNPEYLTQREPYLLALMVMCWVAGFDVIYALQDVAFDREKQLHSMPASLGEERALWISRALHVVSLTSLIAMARLSPQLDVLFAVGIGIVAALLILEHSLVWKSKTHHINMAFFTVNGIISMLLGALGIVDVVRAATHGQ